MLLKKILDESNHKPNKIWVEKGIGFYNGLMKSYFQNNDIEMYSRHNKAKSVIVERLIETLKKIKFINS